MCAYKVYFINTEIHIAIYHELFNDKFVTISIFLSAIQIFLKMVLSIT